MKVEARVLDVNTNMTGERVGMTIDPGALAHIMGVLTDLYSNPELAVIREYSTNARDAHIEAGKGWKPIEVTLPTNLAPFFRVRDFGDGLNAQDIRDIYSQYGTSTKRDTNDAVGMLGLGCKSALTYTDQFTITGIKNGIQTQVSVSRDEDGSGSMTIVSEEASNDPSGVEIIVPVKNGNHFKHDADEFFRFWNKGTVLVNGAEPDRVDGFWIADDLLLTEAVEQDMIVMGNVAYPMKEQDYRHGYHHVVAFVNIGDVNFTPSREALQMTNKTKATIALIRDRVAAEKDAAIERLINEAPSKPEALTLLLNAQRLGISKNLKYKGVEVPLVVKAPDNKKFIFAKVKSYYREKGWSAEKQIVASTYRSSVWLTGYTSDEFSSYKREKLTQWANKHKFAADRFILVSEIPAELKGWINDDTVRPWAEVEAEKIVREKIARRDGRVSGSYEGYVDGAWTRTILAEDIDTSKPIIYADKHWNVPAAIHRAYPKGYTFVNLGSNRVNKFKRDFPTAVEVGSHVRELALNWKKSLTKQDLQTLTIHVNVREMERLRVLDEAQVDDPELAEAIKQAKTKTALVKDYKNLNGYLNLDLGSWKSPLDRYPLLTPQRHYDTISLTGKNKNHAYLYINAVYAASQEA